MRLKGIWICFWVFAFNTCGLAANRTDSIYIGTITLGYVTKRVWGEHELPLKAVALNWDIICVFLFSSVGAMM